MQNGQGEYPSDTHHRCGSVAGVDNGGDVLLCAGHYPTDSGEADSERDEQHLPHHKQQTDKDRSDGGQHVVGGNRRFG